MHERVGPCILVVVFFSHSKPAPARSSQPRNHIVTGRMLNARAAGGAGPSGAAAATRGLTQQQAASSVRGAGRRCIQTRGWALVSLFSLRKKENIIMSPTPWFKFCLVGLELNVFSLHTVRLFCTMTHKTLMPYELRFLVVEICPSKFKSST